MRFLALLIAATLPSAPAYAAEEGKFPRPIFQTTESLLKDFAVIRGCPERLWPGLSWDSLVVVGIDEKRSLQRGLVMSSGERFEIPIKDLPNPASAKSAYGFATKDGQTWMTLNRSYTKVEPLPHALFDLGSHEAFHMIGQRGWHYPSGRRGTKIPVRWEPRYYRYEMQKNLREAFLSPERAAELLGKARYWNERWKQEFPDEVAHNTDGYEGTARYVEYLASGIARSGCQMPEAELRKFVSARLQKEELPDFYFSSSDSEGYFAGSVASYILRWDQRSPGWEKELVEGTTPVDILLAKYEPMEDAGSESVRHSFRNYAMMRQDNIDEKIGATRALVEQKDSVWISLSMQEGAGGGSVTSRGHYVDDSVGLTYQVMVSQLTWQNTLRSADGLIAIWLTGDRPCGPEVHQAVVVAASEVKETNGHFEVNGAKIKGTVRGEKKLAGGRTWICPAR